MRKDEEFQNSFSNRNRILDRGIIGPNQFTGNSNKDDALMEKIIGKGMDFACENPMLLAGVGCVSAGVAVLYLTAGAATPIAGPMITVGLGLITAYFAAKSAEILATSIAKPVIMTVAQQLISTSKAAVSQMTSLPSTLTNRSAAVTSVVPDQTPTKNVPVGNTDTELKTPRPSNS